jgi:RNA polymerase sigma factor (sigma-70 family)
MHPVHWTGRPWLQLARPDAVALRKTDMEELELIGAARGGDRQVFNELVIRYQAIAYNVAYRILGNPDAAADATQDAFISAYRGMARFRGGSFKAWLLRIVTNACYDQLRAQKRHPTSSLDAILVTGSFDHALHGERDEQPEQHAERRELGQLIQRGLSALPPDQRAVVVLADIQEIKYNEIARILNISLGTVKSRLSRGRRKLRDYLQANMELLPARYRLCNETSGSAGIARLFAGWAVDEFVTRLLGSGKR